MMMNLNKIIKTNKKITMKMIFKSMMEMMTKKIIMTKKRRKIMKKIKMNDT